MAHILKEEKYPNGSLKYRETELHGQPGQQVILEESWYISRVDPWQATDAAQQRSGQLKCKENFVNGQKHGIQEWWYPSQADPSDPWQATDAAQQQYRYNYVNGQQHGIQEGWYQNGQQRYKYNFVNGQQHGLQEAWWYPSGVDPSDPWQATDAARQRGGQLEYKGNYVNGQKHGLQEGWYDNGQQWYKENHVNGQQHGVQECWNENGQQKYKKYYLDGVEKSQQAYQSYTRGLAPEIQAVTDFEERGLSGIIAGYLLP